MNAWTFIVSRLKDFFKLEFSVLCFVFAKHDICGMKNIWKRLGKNKICL